MEPYNFREDLESILSEREFLVFSHRKGIFGLKKMTLQELGNSLKITRERVRQIEETANEKFIKSIGNDLSSIDDMDYLEKGTSKYNDYTVTLAKTARRGYQDFSLNGKEFLVNQKLHSTLLVALSYTATLKKYPASVRREMLQEKLNKLQLKEPFISLFLDYSCSRKTQREHVFEVLESHGYPMHFTEILNVLLDMGINVSEKQVLNILVGHPRDFARVSNGTYTLTSPDRKKSVPFIKDLIIKYLKKFKTGTPQSIYKFVSGIRQCRYSSIAMYLTMNNDFEQVNHGVFRIRENSQPQTRLHDIEISLSKLNLHSTPTLKNLIQDLHIRKLNYTVTDILNYLKINNYRIIDNKITKC